MSKNAVITDGLTTTEQYDQLVKSDFFKEIEDFSDDFIAKVGSMIQSYNIRWVPDPLHQWSRQWEYPYIINQLKSAKKDARIVDLGAGLSFLPYYLKQKYGLNNILAVDYDDSLADLYKKVNTQLGQELEFMSGDMRDLNKIKDAEADFVYSVSVLEHTDSYPTVLKEIHRILKPGGKLVLTFDISIDGLDDIPLERAESLLQSINDVFGSKLDINLANELQKQDLITSQLMSKKDKSLMPWKIPAVNTIKHLLKHGKPGLMYKNLTFCCLTVSKKG